jgi:hypothetical protein
MGAPKNCWRLSRHAHVASPKRIFAATCTRKAWRKTHIVRCVPVATPVIAQKFVVAPAQQHCGPGLYAINVQPIATTRTRNHSARSCHARLNVS